MPEHFKNEESKQDNEQRIKNDSLTPEQMKSTALRKRNQDELLRIEQEIILLKNQGRNTVILEGDAKRTRREIEFLAPHAGIPDRESWKDKDPYVFRESNVKELKTLLKTWHSYKPDYIFLTETSAVPYGYAIREAWRVAYPDEKLPVFYRVEPWTESDHIVEIGAEDDIDELIKETELKSDTHLALGKIKEGIADYLRGRIKKSDANIIIFDQYDKSMQPQDAYWTKSKSISGLAKELYKSFPASRVYYAGVNNIDGWNPDKLDFGRSTGREHPRVTLKRNVNHEKKRESLSSPGNRIDPLDQESPKEIIQAILQKGYRPIGKLIKDPKRRREALQYIQALKEVGKIAGQEFLQDKQKSELGDKK